MLKVIISKHRNIENEVFVTSLSVVQINDDNDIRELPALQGDCSGDML